MRIWSFNSVGAGLLACAAAIATQGASAQTWRDTFQSSPAANDVNTLEEYEALASRFKSIPGVSPAMLEQFRPIITDGTVRYHLGITKGGRRLTVTISNEAGTIPLDLSSASVARGSSGFAADPAAVRRLTFGGNRMLTLAPGKLAVSDPVDLPVPDGGIVLVSLFGSHRFVLTPNRGSALASAAGDQTMTAVLKESAMGAARPLVSAIAVEAPATTRVVAAFGDSITDGNRPALGVLHSWPERLYKRLNTGGLKSKYSVVNAGIAGNQVLRSGLLPSFGVGALDRLDRDVLRLSGLSHIVMLEGINDINSSGETPFGKFPALSASQLIDGYRQIIARAHAKGVKVIMGTLTPFAGLAMLDTPDRQKLRADVNQWIRTSGEPDGVVDFDKAVRDPANPLRLLPAFDSGDHLHPNEAGSRAMGDAIDLGLLR